MNYKSSFKNRMYSGDNIVNLSDVRYLPRWIILLIDIFLIFVATAFSAYIIGKLSYNTQVFYSDVPMYSLIIGMNIVFTYIFKTYA